MNPNIATLVSVCERLGIEFQLFHGGKNILKLKTPTGPRFFVNWSTPFNDHTTVRLCEDKDYTQTLLANVVQMPRTRSFLDPDVNPIYNRYRTHLGQRELADQIEFEFSYPFIIKRNRGSHGTNVFVVQDRTELESSINAIFNKSTKEYDFVLLAQERIDIETEYRAIFLEGEQIFSYQKNITGAKFKGNLSPFRWGDARAVLEVDSERIAAIDNLLKPIWSTLPVPFVGADVAVDQAGSWWLIELNSAPSFNFFIRDCGPQEVEKLYEKMLGKMKVR